MYWLDGLMFLLTIAAFIGLTWLLGGHDDF